MEITRNALENMMITYVNHKKMMMKYENDDDFELEENPEYFFYKGCCETEESWMRGIGVSPQCNFIMEKLYG